MSIKVGLINLVSDSPPIPTAHHQQFDMAVIELCITATNIFSVTTIHFTRTHTCRGSPGIKLSQPGGNLQNRLAVVVH